MKKYFLLLAIGITFLVNGVFAQASKADIDKKIHEIKGNISNLQKIDSVIDSNGYDYAYAKDRKLQFVKVYHKDGNTDHNVEWYFSNGKEIYAEQIWTDRASGKIINNERIYLADSKLIYWIRTNGIVVDTASEQFKKEAVATAAYAKNFEAYYEGKLKEGQ